MLSKDQLITMLEHIPEIRREANSPTTQSEINERAALSHVHDADRIKLEQAHGAQPDLQQQHERNLLDIISTSPSRLACKPNGSPCISKRKTRPRPANTTLTAAAPFAPLTTSTNNVNIPAPPRTGLKKPRAVSNRMNTKDKPIRSNLYTKGKELTSEQRANPSPEARQRIEREERTAAAREVGAKGKDQNAQQGNANTGKSPSGGRSR